MWKLLARWTGGRDTSVTDDSAFAQSEIQCLRLELVERDAIIATLRQDRARERAARDRQIAEVVDHRLESLFHEVAAPVAQFLTQAFLVDQPGKEVTARDVVRVARRIVRGLEDAGLEIRDVVGSEAKFDANLHEPLRSGEAITLGTAVAIRFCGIAYRGRVLWKAGVAPVEG